MDNRPLAKQRALNIVTEWKRQIELARSAVTNIGSKAFKWRRLVDESRSAGLTEAEIEDVSLDVLNADDPEAEEDYRITIGKKHLLSGQIQSNVATLTTEQKTAEETA